MKETKRGRPQIEKPVRLTQSDLIMKLYSRLQTGDSSNSVISGLSYLQINKVIEEYLADLELAIMDNIDSEIILSEEVKLEIGIRKNADRYGRNEPYMGTVKVKYSGTKRLEFNKLASLKMSEKL